MRHTEKEDGNVEVVIRHGAKPFIGWTLTEVCAIWAGFEICGTRTGFASFAVLQTVLMSVLYGLCVWKITFDGRTLVFKDWCSKIPVDTVLLKDDLESSLKNLKGYRNICDFSVRDKGSGRPDISIWPDSRKQIEPLVAALEEAGVEVKQIEIEKKGDAGCVFFFFARKRGGLTIYLVAKARKCPRINISAVQNVDAWTFSHVTAGSDGVRPISRPADGPVCLPAGGFLRDTHTADSHAGAAGG